jgi:hypothetical protein
MPFKPNYNQQRSDRDRAKRQKQQEKLKKREDDANRRKTERGGDAPPTPNGHDPEANKPVQH